MWVPYQLSKSNNRTQTWLVLTAAVALAVTFLFITASGAVVADGTAPTHDSISEVNSSVGVDTGTNLTILQYNDIQTAMADNESMARLVGAINDRKAATDNPTIVVGGGDEVSPSSLSAVSEWQVPIDVMNVLNPAAEVIGNHDLDYGFEPVKNFTEASNFPWLVANIQAEDGSNIPGTQDYTTVERDGVKIGILGLVDDAIDPKTAVDFAEQGYEVTDWSQAGSEVATTLEKEENVDVVVALTHTGVPESKEIANNTDNIDVIVTGDDEVLHEPAVTSGTVIIEAGGEATHLGELSLSVTDEQVGFNGGRLYNLEEGDWSMNESADQAVQAGRTEGLTTVAGETTEPLDSTFGNYADDTGWGRIIGDAFLAQTGADVAMTNAGGIRGNFMLEAGELTYDDIYTSLPFGNTLVTKKMSGSEIVEYLSRTAAPFDSDFGVQPELQVAGLTYEVVDRPDPPQKIKDVHVHGEPIEMDKSYEVTVNSYMAGGPMLSELETVNNDLTLYGTAAVNYIEEQGTVTPPQEDRIRRTTRAFGEPTISLDGETATLEYDVPAAVDSIEEQSLTLMNETTGQLAVDAVEFDGDSLRLSVNQRSLISLSEQSDTVQLYGTYTDSEIDSQRNGFNMSRLNADAMVSQAVRLKDELETVNTELEDTQSELSDTKAELDEAQAKIDEKNDEISGLKSTLSEKEDRIDELENANADSSDSDGPGFTLLIAVGAVVSLALVGTRRQA
ncbi:5'-nucleotidase C-terminal domain-containing protein [Halovenus rubra]|uniref:5'-nucleotidase C-terminal domain-containing protein n=2 Tax=Halovenus rubra TaxID=869890 RepID=A0ACC7E3J1_9EURY|nr:5'-nucleotidase C-terminal domain-containing protein [Halovenus rubra]